MMMVFDEGGRDERSSEGDVDSATNVSDVSFDKLPLLTC